MNKKQQYRINLFLFFLSTSCLFSLDAHSQSITEKMNEADELFKQKKFTESFEHYEEILSQEKQATPQMLMKMAYIKEGLGNYSEALFYLDQYYEKTADKRARVKMSELANQHKLNGYQINDSSFFKGLLNEFYNPIAFSFILFAAVLLGIGGYYKIVLKKKAMGLVIPGIFLLLTFVFINNHGLGDDKGIIVSNHAYLMSGPSAGADLIEVVQKGHRVPVLNTDDVWVQIEWNGQTAYIRKNKIKLEG